MTRFYRQLLHGSTRLPIAAILLLACLGGNAWAAERGEVCNPRSFGAKADGITKDTRAIQAAIDHCAARGGGTVELSGGFFLSAPIRLKSNITLRIEAGAALLGSADHADYPPKIEFREPGLTPLVSATRAHNVAITGGGLIDGQGRSWWAMARHVRDAGVMGNPHPRPRLVVFDHCKDVRVEGITLQNSPFWQLVPYSSDHVLIRNVHILAPADSPNTDALDPFSSSNVIIDHLYADVGDDDIAIKSGAIHSPGPDLPARNIRITNCTFVHGHGLSIGSEIAGGAQDILVDHIRFTGTTNGIRIKANRDRGHDVSHIVFRNLEMRKVQNTILINEYYPGTLPRGGVAAAPVTRLTPHFHDILIENLTSTGGRNAGIVAGLPESPITGLVLRNVSIQAQKGLTVAYAEVSGRHVAIQPASGAAVIKLAHAAVSFR